MIKSLMYLFILYILLYFPHLLVRILRHSISLLPPLFTTTPFSRKVPYSNYYLYIYYNTDRNE